MIDALMGLGVTILIILVFAALHALKDWSEG